MKRDAKHNIATIYWDEKGKLQYRLTKDKPELRAGEVPQDTMNRSDNESYDDFVERVKAMYERLKELHP